MKNDRIDIHKTIEVRQLGWGVRGFDLSVEGEPVARLSWPKWASDFAVGEWGVERWGFDRPGFFRDKLEIYERDEALYATLHYDWLKDGKLCLRNGRAYHWQKTRAFCDEWALTDENGFLIYQIEAWHHWFKLIGNFRFGDAAISCANLKVLVLAGWYLAFKHTEDIATVVAATVVV